MKILVLVKYVPDATSERKFAADGTLDRASSDGLLSELDEYAVEQALQIADERDDVEVVALTLGPEAAADAIKRALQMGASAGIHISDGAMGVIPVMIAERLGWPAATLGATLSLDSNTVSIRRDADTASLTIEAELPALVSVTDQSGEARYPSMKGILAAKKKPVETWTLADVGIDPSTVGLDAALTKVLRTTPRPPKQAGRVITDEAGSGAAALTDFLSTGKYL